MLNSEVIDADLTRSCAMCHKAIIGNADPHLSPLNILRCPIGHSFIHSHCLDNPDPVCPHVSCRQRLVRATKLDEVICGDCNEPITSLDELSSCQRFHVPIHESCREKTERCLLITCSQRNLAPAILLAAKKRERATVNVLKLGPTDVEDHVYFDLTAHEVTRVIKVKPAKILKAKAVNRPNKSARNANSGSHQAGHTPPVRRRSLG